MKILLLVILVVFYGCEQSDDSPSTITLPSTPQNPGDTTDPDPDPPNENVLYRPLGVGGGGAMSGVAINPYNQTWYVGTDMGTLFRSPDHGETWLPVNHYQAQYDSRLELATSPGFSSDGQTVFFANAGRDPKRSTDNGINFQSIQMNLLSNERILYWTEDPRNPNFILAATTNGLLRTNDLGQSWTRTQAPASRSLGTYIDFDGESTEIYHATQDAILLSINLGDSFTIFHDPEHNIRMFDAGRSNQELTLAYSDDDGQSACAWAIAYTNDWGQSAINKHLDHCGYVWVKNGNSPFTKTSQVAGNFIRMADNDSQTIYTTGAKEWIRQTGSTVHVSQNAGESWELKLFQMDWDNGYSPWPSDLIEYSAIALDVGWYDNGFESFAINSQDSSQAAGTGYFFLHSTLNKGENWLAPFTQYADSGLPTYDKKWKTGGIEVISVYRLESHPNNSELIYAATADIGGMVSDDNGETFRITRAFNNSNYDYSFDPNNDYIVYAASGNEHDYPVGWHANATTSDGGIFKSLNRGLSWQRLTPNNNEYNRQFLSVAFDHRRGYIYGGSHGDGLAFSSNDGASWSWFNNGLPSGSKIVSQLEVDPMNGNIYALLTGDAPTFSNRANTGIYFLDVENNSNTWELLRGNVAYPESADLGYQLWWYPTGFAIDFSDPQRNTLWLIDYENKGNWLMTGAWKSIDRGENWERKIQFTHPTAINIDPENSDYIYVSGQHYLDNSWGNGGQLFSKDGGETWFKNLSPELQANARNVMIDPNDPEKVYYTYFGGGIMKGPNPTRQPSSLEITEVND